MRYFWLITLILQATLARAVDEVRVRAEEACAPDKVDACLTKRADDCERILGLVCAEAGLKLASAGEATRAAPFLNRACRLGVGASCTILGEESATKGERNAALVYFTKACLLGHLPACAELKKRTPPRQVASKKRELGLAAKAWIDTHIASSGDDPCARLSPEECFHAGERARKEGRNADLHYQSACEGRHAPACNRLGWLAQQRNDLERARKHYDLACTLGESKGCNNLGWLAEQEGRVGDAIRWYEAACGRGHPKACKRHASLKGP